MEDMGLTTKLRNSVYELYHNRMRQEAFDVAQNGDNNAHNNIITSSDIHACICKCQPVTEYIIHVQMHVRSLRSQSLFD